MIEWILFNFRVNFSKDKQFYKIINEIFGTYPNNIELYKLALIHKSASVVLDNGIQINNERLEFLGDAIIESIVSDMLYIEFPYESEGLLTQLRSRIVSRNSLNELSVRMGIDKHMICQNTYGSSQRRNIYGDAFEAMMGALYLDKGFDYCNRLLINKIFKQYINLNELIETEADYKSRLIEWAQKNKIKLTMSSNIDDGADFVSQQFVTVVKVAEDEVGFGIGNSKKEAEQRACKNAAASLGLNF